MTAGLQFGTNRIQRIEESSEPDNSGICRPRPAFTIYFNRLSYLVFQPLTGSLLFVRVDYPRLCRGEIVTFQCRQ